MFASFEEYENALPTPDAYDGAWLELLENPDASLAGPDGRDSDNSSSPVDKPGDSTADFSQFD